LYNFVFVIGRAVFWELNNAVPALWWTLDYTCDIIYLLDTIIHAHEGKREHPRRGLLFRMLTVQHVENNKTRKRVVNKVLVVSNTQLAHEKITTPESVSLSTMCLNFFMKVCSLQCMKHCKNVNPQDEIGKDSLSTNTKMQGQKL
jgi:hypothetical protein